MVMNWYWHLCISYLETMKLNPVSVGLPGSSLTLGIRWSLFHTII